MMLEQGSTFGDREGLPFVFEAFGFKFGREKGEDSWTHRGFHPKP